MKNRKAKVVDTSVMVHDPICLRYLAQKGVVACIPWTVLEELDGLKNRNDIGFDAREAIRNLEEMRRMAHPSLSIVQDMDWGGIESLDRHVNDHRIIAAANDLKKQYARVELVSKDSMMRIKARELGFVAEDYYRDQAENGTESELPRIEVTVDEIDSENFSFPYQAKKHGSIPENGGVVCLSDWRGDFKRPDECTDFGENFAAVRHGDRFQIISNTISAFGIRAYAGDSVDTERPPRNWPQIVALYHLTHPGILLVFLEGGAGTGKTLLALAAALECRKLYRQILVTRPMVHLEDKDNMGFLPGDVKDKMAPWLRPIWQNLFILKEMSAENREMIERYLNEKKIDVEPLDYIRGTTFWKCLLIIDEAQNLTPHQVKTIITRAGNGSKIIFTGDLDQIDRKRRLDKISSGLAYAASRLTNQKLVASIKFKESVRSELARIGVELL